jgi:hypothetical protein
LPSAAQPFAFPTRARIAMPLLRPRPLFMA